MLQPADDSRRPSTSFALVLARSDGRLGPQLKKSTADCAPPSSPNTPGRCGMRMGQGTIEATGVTLDRMLMSLGSLAGGQISNRTGLDGPYDVSLRFAPPRLNPDPSAPVD